MLPDGVYRFESEEDLKHFVKNINWINGNIAELSIEDSIIIENLTILLVRLLKKHLIKGLCFSHHQFLL